MLLLARPFFSAPRLRRTLYGLLPLVWALLLARHLPIGMAEAGAVLPVSLAPLLPVDSVWWQQLPSWRADSHVIGFCQSAVVLLGALAAVVVLRRLLANNRVAWLGASVMALLLACAGRWLVA